MLVRYLIMLDFFMFFVQLQNGQNITAAINSRSSPSPTQHLQESISMNHSTRISKVISTMTLSLTVLPAFTTKVDSSRYQTVQTVITTTETFNFSPTTSVQSRDASTRRVTSTSDTPFARTKKTTTETTTRRPTLEPKRKFLVTAFIPISAPPKDNQNFMSALIVAKEMINENIHVLSDYKVDVNFINVPYGIYNVLQPIVKMVDLDEEKPVALLGPVWSAQFETCRHVIDEKNVSLLEMNFGVTDATFSSKKLNPHVFSLIPSYATLNTAIIHLFKNFGWKRTGLMFTAEFEFFPNNIDHRLIEDIAEKFEENQIDVVSRTTIQFVLPRDKMGFVAVSNETKKNIFTTLNAMKEKDIRIIVGTFSEHHIAFVMCQAHKLKMTSSKYYWILTNYVTEVRWHERYNGTDCTQTELYEASKNVVLVERMFRRIDNVKTIGNMTADEVWEKIKAKRREIETEVADKSILEYEEKSIYAYDALWTVALALDKVIKKYSCNETSFSFDDSTYANRLVGEMEKVFFEGASGTIRFRDGERGRTVDYTTFEVYGNGSFTRIGSYNAENDDVMYNITYQEQLFPDGYNIPVDGLKTILYPVKFSRATIITLWIFTFIATCLSLYFLSINIMYRMELLIKMSSPKVNNLIVLGCLLCYSAVILYGVDVRLIDAQKIPTICNTIVICLTFGFTLAFGALFSKTWRIYRIFTCSMSLRGVVIKDYHLYGVIFLMLCVDSVILTTWMLISPFELGTETISLKILPELDEVHQHIIYRCNCELQLQYGIVVFLYKGILLIFGSFLAWETRDIKVAVINDSKYIGMAVYSVGVFASIGSICSFALYQTSFYTELYIVFAVCILFCTTFTLVIVFAPKVHLMLNDFKDPNFRNGRPILFSSMSSSHRGINSSIYSKSERGSGNWGIQRRGTVISDPGTHKSPEESFSQSIIP